MEVEHLFQEQLIIIITLVEEQKILINKYINNMVYRDLFKISIYVIAIKLFVDSMSMLSGKVYESLVAENWIINILLYLCLNFLAVFLLFKFNNYLVDKVFPKRKNYLNKDVNISSIFKISIVICSYYIILTTGFSLINNLFSILRIDSIVIGQIISIVISVLLLLFSNTITKKLTFTNE